MNERRIEKYMGLLEMGYSDPTADLHVEGVCVDFDRFLADLESVAGTTDDKCEEFPTEAYHAHMGVWAWCRYTLSLKNYCTPLIPDRP